MDEPRIAVSRVCADPKTAGQRHPGCSGGVCICPCHGVRPPKNFRDRVLLARETKASSPGDNAPVAGLDARGGDS